MQQNSLGFRRIFFREITLYSKKQKGFWRAGKITKATAYIVTAAKWKIFREITYRKVVITSRPRIVAALELKPQQNFQNC